MRPEFSTIFLLHMKINKQPYMENSKTSKQDLSPVKMWSEHGRWIWRISLFCFETQYFYRPACASRAWIIVSHSWSCRYETKSGKTKSLKMEAGQAKPTHGVVQIILAFPFLHIKVTQRTENPPIFRGSIATAYFYRHFVLYKHILVL